MYYVKCPVYNYNTMSEINKIKLPFISKIKQIIVDNRHIEIKNQISKTIKNKVNSIKANNINKKDLNKDTFKRIYRDYLEGKISKSDYEDKIRGLL